MMDLDDLRMFRALASVGSLAGAARSMGVTPPALSVRLRKLEQGLGIKLVVRGARGTGFTLEGQRLLEEAQALLERMDGVAERIAGRPQTAEGRLRIVAPGAFGRLYMAPLVRSFHQAHRKVAVDLGLSDTVPAKTGLTDVVIHIGAVAGSAWSRQVLAPNRQLLCASPVYAGGMGELSHPSQLARHNCLCLRDGEETMRWKFSSTQGKAGVQVPVEGGLSSNDSAVISQWLLGGLGIAVRAEWEAAPLIASGQLLPLLPHWQLEAAPVVALTPARKPLSMAARLFLDAARHAFASPPWR